MKNRNKSMIFLTILLFCVVISSTSIEAQKETVEDECSDYIQFYAFTLYSPINRTYNSKSIPLDISFSTGLGSNYTLTYTLDGGLEVAIPFEIENSTGLHAIYPAYGHLMLPELSEGNHNLTINMLSYTGYFTGSVQFTIDTQSQPNDIPEFPSSENWVEVTTLSGSGGIGSTKTFTVDHADWRIRWEIEPSNHSERQSFLVYVFPATGIKGSEQWIESIQHFGTEETTGVANIYNHSGSFYMDVLASIDSYTMIIEQNTDSIPEFPSWMILPIFVLTTIAIIFCKNRLDKTNNKFPTN
jgi:hypothetical protein